MSTPNEAHRQVPLRVLFLGLTLASIGLATSRAGDAWTAARVELLGVFLFGAGIGGPLGFSAQRWGGAAVGAVAGGIAAMLLLLSAEVLSMLGYF